LLSQREGERKREGIVLWSAMVSRATVGLGILGMGLAIEPLPAHATAIAEIGINLQVNLASPSFPDGVIAKASTNSGPAHDVETLSGSFTVTNTLGVPFLGEARVTYFPAFIQVDNAITDSASFTVSAKGDIFADSQCFYPSDFPISSGGQVTGDCQAQGDISVTDIPLLPGESATLNYDFTLTADAFTPVSEPGGLLWPFLAAILITGVGGRSRRHVTRGASTSPLPPH
jgi:hypothetical protein